VYNMVMVYPSRPPQVFLSLAQFEARIGLRRGGLSGAKLPPPDAIIGPVNKDGSLPKGTVRGWLPETVDYWKRTRLGAGFPFGCSAAPVARLADSATVEHNGPIPAHKFGEVTGRWTTGICTPPVALFETGKGCFQHPR
jgi:hypothetical protein